MASPEWWTREVARRSLELWLPSVNDFCDNTGAFPSSCINSLKGKMFASLHSLSSHDLRTHTTPREIEPEDDDEEVINSCVKVEIKPTPEERTKLKMMFGSHRAVWNEIVARSRGRIFQMTDQEIAQEFRPIATKATLTNYLPACHLVTPSQVLNSTYRDIIKAKHAAWASYCALLALGQNPSPPTELRFKSRRRDNSTSVVLPLQQFSVTDAGWRARFFSRYFGYRRGSQAGIVTKEPLPAVTTDVRLQFMKTGKFYICIPRHRNYEQSLSARVCAIDPGVRDFLSIHDPDGFCMAVFDADEKFEGCFDAIDEMKSRRDNETNKRKRYRLKKTIYQMHQKVKRRVNDLHQKLTKWLAQTFHEVMLPVLDVKSLVRRNGRPDQQPRTLSRLSTRKLMAWSHYKFRLMLRDKMRRVWGRLIECTEPYTTKTCTHCGRINRSMGRQKVFRCPECGFRCDRDVNAARNIYLMNEQLLTRD